MLMAIGQTAPFDITKRRDIFLVYVFPLQTMEEAKIKAAVRQLELPLASALHGGSDSRNRHRLENLFSQERKLKKTYFNNAREFSVEEQINLTVASENYANITYHYITYT